MLFPEDEIQPRIQHSKQFFKYFEEDMTFLERWLARDEGCIEVAKLVGLEKNNSVSYNSITPEKKMQPTEVDNKLQSRNKFDKEIDELLKLMKQHSKSIYRKEKKTFS